MICGFVIEPPIARSKIEKDMIETPETPIPLTSVYATDQVHLRTDATVPDDDADGTEVIIQPRSGWIAIDWREMIAHRELLAFLICAISRSGTSKPFWAAPGRSCSPCC